MLKIGDKVKILDGHHMLSDNGIGFVGGMDRFIGNVTYVTDVCEEEYGNSVSLNIDRNAWCWDCIWLEKMEN